MTTITKAELKANGSLQLTTDAGAIIDCFPRIPLDTANLTVTCPRDDQDELPLGVSTADLSTAALLNLCADLSDRVSQQEARLAELVNYIRNVANALPKPDGRQSTDSATPTEVADHGPTVILVASPDLKA